MLFHTYTIHMTQNLHLIAGNSNIALAHSVADLLGVPITAATIKKFADKEVFVEILQNIRDKDTFILQSTCYPANDNIMEMLVTIDALKRASAGRITCVIPYFGYARQDRKQCPRTPISSKLVANLIRCAGADRVLIMDLHAEQIQGFFDIPIDLLYASPIFINYIRNIIAKSYDNEKMMIVSPDVGAVTRSRVIAKKLNYDLAIIDKRREKAGVSEVMNVIGDVQGANCVIVDDIVDSGGTLCNASDALLAAGAKSVVACITHPVLSGQAVQKIENSSLAQVIITNSIPLGEKKSSKFVVLDTSPIISDAIRRVHNSESVSELFV